MVGSQAPYANKPAGYTRRVQNKAPFNNNNQHNPYNYYPYSNVPHAFYAPPLLPSYAYPTYQSDPQNYYDPQRHLSQQNSTSYKSTYYYSRPELQREIPVNYHQTDAQLPSPFIQPSANTQQSPPNQLPRIIFPGDIIIVDSTDKVKPALEELFRDGTARTHGIGFDMEWQPNFGKGSPRNPTSLIQLATDRVCVIFWMMHLGHYMPVELFEVLASPNILKIGQCLDCGDNERLNQEFHLFLANNVDISILAKQKGYRKTNLKEQTKVLLGKNLSKYLCTSNWADIHLTPAQIRYAATDAYVTFLIYHKLVALPDLPTLPVAPPIEDREGEGEGSEDKRTSTIITEGEKASVELIVNMNVTVKQALESATTTSQGSYMAMSTPCPHCDRYFMKKVQLYAHLDCAHLEALPLGPHACAVCAKQFRKYSALKTHEDMTGHCTD